MDIQILSTLAGLLSMGITIVGIVLGGIYVGKSTAGRTASDAQQNAITAMQSEINTLRGRTDDLKKENARQELIVDTICIALKTRGLIISIQGEMVTIQDGASSTTTKIHSTRTSQEAS